MRTIITTLIGVMLALLTYEGIRYAARREKQPSQLDVLAEMSSRTENQAVAANWDEVQSHVELLRAQGKYKQASDFAAAHAAERPVHFDLSPGVKVDSETLQRATKAVEESLKTPDARLVPLENSASLLWPPVLEHHERWRLAELRRACGKPKKIASYTDEKQNTGGLDYPDARGNSVHFEFFSNGVTVYYADPKHVRNADLIASLRSMPCLSAVK